MPVVGFGGWMSFRPELLAPAFVMVGTLFVALAVGWFLIGKRGLPVRDLDPAERSWYSREAAILLAELAPMILSLEEQSLELDLLSMDASRAREVQEAMSRTETRELWSAFAQASTLVEEDPKRAVEQLRWLRPRLRDCVMSLDGLLDRELASGTSVERSEGDGRA